MYTDDEENVDGSGDRDEEEAHDDAPTGDDQSFGNRRTRRTSITIMKEVLGDASRKKEKRTPLERRWKLFDLIMGFLWWVASMFFLYLTIVNIGGK